MCAAVFVSILINSSHAQSVEFKTYTDNDMNFTIQYPSNWEFEYSRYKQPDIIDFSVVYFSGPEDGPIYFQVGMEEVEPYLATDTMTLQNTSLQQHVQKELDGHLSSDNVKIIRQNEVTVGGNTGYKIESSTSHENSRPTDYDYGLPDSYSFVIFTLANGKFYRLSYTDEPLKVPETLPLVNKMVESFRII